MSACTFQGFLPSTPADRSAVEKKIRNCAPSLRNGRWTYSKENEQREFGFEVTLAEFHGSNLALCIDKISSQLPSKHSDIIIAYSASQGAAN
jgi:hypothetical protein